MAVLGSGTPLRWAVSIAAWEPGPAEWACLLTALPPHEAERVGAFRHAPDRKRAAISRLLQRAACRIALGCAVKFDILRCRGGKPYCAHPPGQQRPGAPNWNYNVSHEVGWGCSGRLGGGRGPVLAGGWCVGRRRACLPGSAAGRQACPPACRAAQQA